jgi:hypothetical protein
VTRPGGRHRGGRAAVLSGSYRQAAGRQDWGKSKKAPPTMSAFASSPFCGVASVTTTARRRVSASTRTSSRLDPWTSSTPKRMGLNAPSNPALLSSSMPRPARMKAASSGPASSFRSALCQMTASGASTITSRPFTSWSSRTPSYRNRAQAPSSIRPFAKHAAWRQLSKPGWRVSISQSGRPTRLQRIRAAYRAAGGSVALESMIRSTGPDAVAMEAIRPFASGVAARASFRDPGKA